MKLVSWNVNGIRATLGKGLAEKMDALQPDVLCLQAVGVNCGRVENV